RMPKARQVLVSGTFSSWTPRPLSRRHQRWETELYLTPGRYEYNFIVDGKIRPDPLQPILGTKGSVLIVR
ncbi:MAG: hypothetical protein PHW69_05925, partial [Elusimicrobiaceae bacterium]|nr:hypothetical protein [Elusimicrobiaceae bacterium]